MVNTFQNMLNEENVKVPMVEPEKTLTRMDDPLTAFLDLMDGNSIKEIGIINATVHAERGSQESLVDQKHSMRKAELSPGMRVVLYHGDGSQETLAGKTLLDMEFDKVVYLGSYQNWKDAGKPAGSL